jgi:serine phosphatase RsbU (regulator of sigma subunit)
MPRQTLGRIVILAVALLAASPVVRGQEPAPLRFRRASFAEEGATVLVRSWRYHAGDDPRWAEPAFDDSGWEAVEPQLLAGGRLPRDGWQGAGWFRRHLRVDPELWGKPLVVRVESSGETAVFLDGAPWMEVPAAGPGRRAGHWRELVFSPQSDHVLAVRHRLPWSDRLARDGNLGFLLSIETPEAATLEKAGAERRGAWLAFLVTVPMLLALFHLALFGSYPRARENLFFALTLAASAAIVACDRWLAAATDPAWRALSAPLTVSSILVTIFLSLLTMYALRTRAFPRSWVAFAVLGGLLLAAVWALPEVWLPRIWSLYFGLTLLEIVRLEATGRTVAREGIRTLLSGFVVLGAVIVLQVLIQFKVVPPIAGVGGVYVFGLLAFELAMSLFLAQSFARTNLHLERRLDEVRDLSEQILAQERAAHGQELQRRVLEVEHARKSSEIESARTLQLSMLPGTIPEVAGLETAAAMATASEVGGDYYDFRLAGDGSLVVAFGDAAGHGVAAGILVTAVKALFSTLGGQESLPAVLAECDRVLREMYVRPLPMCLTLARLTPRSLTLCSAGMPPVLIHRAASGQIEELGAGGRPIGTRLTGVWSEHHVVLNPGDALLFASDGLAEQLNSADRPFGYESVEDAFRGVATGSARDVVESLLAQAAAWRGEREQGDDITLVAIRVAG